ncbi:MAG: phosphatase PAP2 family protein [Candidatus Dormibacteria bacterium]
MTDPSREAPAGTDSPAPKDVAAAAVESVEAVAEETNDGLTEAAQKIAEDAPPQKKAVLREMGGIRALDASIFLAVNHLPHSQSLNDIVETVSDLGKGAGWVVAAAIIALGGNRRVGWRNAAVTTATMLAATGMTQGPVKKYFLRQRPWAVLKEDIVIGKRTTDSSFPSGHTAGSFAAALAMSRCFPDQRPLMLGVAGAVGLSRIYLGHHYPSDVLGGVAIGSAIALASGLVSDRLFDSRC